MIREAVVALDIAHAGSPFGVLTISVGVASMVPGEDDLPVDLMRMADAALYRAKRSGRNQVQVADAEPVT